MDSALLFTNLADHLLFGALGILLSLYALYVELQKERNPNYVALCDINKQMSCSRVLTSEYVQFFFCNGSWIITPLWCQFKCVFIQVSLRYPLTGNRIYSCLEVPLTCTMGFESIINCFLFPFLFSIYDFYVFFFD